MPLLCCAAPSQAPPRLCCAAPCCATHRSALLLLCWAMLCHALPCVAFAVLSPALFCPATPVLCHALQRLATPGHAFAMLRSAVPCLALPSAAMPSLCCAVLSAEARVQDLGDQLQDYHRRCSWSGPTWIAGPTRGSGRYTRYHPQQRSKNRACSQGIKSYRTNPIGNVAYRASDTANVTGSVILPDHIRPYVDDRRSWDQGDRLQDHRHRCELGALGNRRPDLQLGRADSGPGAIASRTIGVAVSAGPGGRLPVGSSSQTQGIAGGPGWR